MTMKRVFSICPYCGCGCGLYLCVVGNEVVGVEPSKLHPITRGSLCMKGWHSYEFLRHPQRLKHPLVKTAGGGFKETDWDSALKLVANRLMDFDPKQIAIIGSAKTTNENSYLLMEFARAVLKTNNIDNCARLCHAPSVAALREALGSAAMTNSINDIEETDVILVTGSNTTQQHPQVARRILKAINRGAQLIVVDPRKIQLAQLAQLHLSPRPGTDIAWINGMLRIIIDENLHNREFITTRCENFDAFRESLEEYTVEYVEKVCGIDGELLRKAAITYATANNAMIIYAMGITQHASATDAVYSLANLALLTGHIGKPHSGINPLRGQNNVQGACDMGLLPGVLTGYQACTDPNTIAKFEKIWETSLPRAPGLTAVEMFNQAHKNNIKCMYITGMNAALSLANIQFVQAALEKLEFLVVLDIFMTETARFADVILPVAAFAEDCGTYTSTERRVQLAQKAVEPPAQARAEWQIIMELANLCGYPMNYSDTAQIAEKIAAVTPIYAGINHDRLKDNHFGLQWPCLDATHMGTRFLHEGKFVRGYGKFTPTKYISLSEQINDEYPFYLMTGRMYAHWHTGTMTRKIPILERECPFCYIEINPQDAKKYGIRDQEEVLVETKRGQVKATAVVTENIKEGELFIPFHFAESCANVLTDDRLDAISKIPSFKVCAARIKKI